ncbi:chorismate mutase [Streptomyces sp. R11]|uniref:Chorismate mutase n=1 Tax=Streptomyces sp. R11 TaxID=3238625 RepID=A0AB39NC13_9ACTN
MRRAAKLRAGLRRIGKQAIVGRRHHSAMETTTNKPDEDTYIVELWDHIQEIDERIIQLLRERAELSNLVESARLKCGGTRTELAAENAVFRHYADGLGSRGSRLAGNVLQVCRQP